MCTSLNTSNSLILNVPPEAAVSSFAGIPFIRGMSWDRAASVHLERCAEVHIHSLENIYAFFSDSESWIL